MGLCQLKGNINFSIGGLMKHVKYIVSAVFIIEIFLNWIIFIQPQPQPTNLEQIPATGYPFLRCRDNIFWSILDTEKYRYLATNKAILIDYKFDDKFRLFHYSTDLKVSCNCRYHSQYRLRNLQSFLFIECFVAN